ncbi:MAG: PDZ domain-containing protein [Sandaracinaceae bacterium]
MHDTRAIRFALLLAACPLVACDGGTALPDAGPPLGDAGGPTDAGPPPAECPEGYPLADLAGKPVFSGTINGQPARIVWDTGAPTSALDDGAFDRIGEGPYTIELGGRTITSRPLSVVDFARYGIDGVDGVFGADIFGDYAVTIDVDRARFWIDDAIDEDALLACSHVAGNPTTVQAVNAGYFYVPGNAEGLEGWFLLDTGASLGAMPDSTFDAIEAANPRPYLSGFYTQAAIGTFYARLAPVARLEMGDLGVDHILTRTVRDDLIPPAPGGGTFLGVVPTGFLRHFLLTVYYPTSEIRLDAYEGDTLREPSQFFVVGISIEDGTADPVHVAGVLEGSAAAEAGVMVGDVIVSVRGTPMASLTPSERPWALVSRGLGEMVDVVIERDGAPMTLMLEARDLLIASPTDM